jgi:flotillin
VMAEQVKIRQVEKEQEIKVQDAEILRHERELIATVLKGAEIERKRIETIAEAEKQRVIAQAEGQAAQKKLDAEAQAAMIRQTGAAEAEIILQKGEAEAKAMNVKAEAYQGWTQAAIVDKLISNMAEVVRAMSEPLSKVDKITIVSTGGEDNIGASKLTGEVTKIASQVPALFEALSGMNLKDLMSNIKAIKPREDEETK